MMTYHTSVTNSSKRDLNKMYKRNNEGLSHYYCCSGKTLIITYSGCVSVALVIQHAMRMHRIIFTSVASLAVPGFSTLSQNGTIFGNKLWNIKYGYSFSL